MGKLAFWRKEPQPDVASAAQPAPMAELELQRIGDLLEDVLAELWVLSPVVLASLRPSGAMLAQQQQRAKERHAERRRKGADRRLDGYIGGPKG